MKLLIVDDDPGICQMLARVFRSDGCAVSVVARGKEAIEWLGRESADLVLLDYHLEDLDAVEVLAAARERQWDLPMIVMSGMGESETAEKARQAGAVEVVEKPFDLAVIRNLVKEHARPG